MELELCVSWQITYPTSCNCSRQGLRGLRSMLVFPGPLAGDVCRK